MVINQEVASVQNFASTLSPQQQGALITWATKINKNGMVPTEGVIVGNQLLEGSRKEIYNILEERVKEAFRENGLQLVVGLQMMIEIINRLISCEKVLYQTRYKTVTSLSPQDVVASFQNEREILQSNLLMRWNALNATIFQNTVKTSLTVGFHNSKDGSSVQLGYAEDETDFISNVNQLCISIDNTVNELSSFSSTETSQEQLQQIMTHHYQGLINSIADEREPYERQWAYIWLWYARRDVYRKIQFQENHNFADIFFSEQKRHSNGATFEAFCQHLYLYHQMLGLEKSIGLNLDGITYGVEAEEGYPEFYHTLLDAGYGETAYYASGDIVTLEENNTIKINSQVKSTSRDTYDRGLKYKQLQKLCQELLSFAQGNGTTPLNHIALSKLITTAYKQSDVKLNQKISDIVDELLCNLGDSYG